MPYPFTYYQNGHLPFKFWNFKYVIEGIEEWNETGDQGASRVEVFRGDGRGLCRTRHCPASS